MRDPNEPLEPDLAATDHSDPGSWPAGQADSVATIPVVEPEAMKASDRPLVEPARCDVATAARTLASLGRARIAVITPDAEPNTGCAVRLARQLAAAGSVIVVDMADERRTSRETGADDGLPGLKDVLTGAERLSVCVATDEMSRAKVLPHGRPDTALSPGSAAMLPVVLDALGQAYSYLVLDAGGADASALGHIADEGTGLIIATGNSLAPEVEQRVDELRRAGFDEPVIVTAG